MYLWGVYALSVLGLRKEMGGTVTGATDPPPSCCCVSVMVCASDRYVVVRICENMYRRWELCAGDSYGPVRRVLVTTMVPKLCNRYPAIADWWVREVESWWVGERVGQRSLFCSIVVLNNFVENLIASYCVFRGNPFSWQPLFVFCYLPIYGM